MFHFAFLWGFLALPGVFALFWLLKNTNRKEILTSSLELWKFALLEKVSFSKIYHIQKIWLSIIAYLFFVIALSDLGWATTRNQYTFIIDRSASMLSTKDQETLFEIGLATAYDVLSDLKTTDQVELILFPEKETFTGSPQQTTKFLQQQKCTHLEANFPQFISEIDLKGEKNFYIISDGNDKIYPSNQNEKINWIYIGLEKTNNIGFTKFHSELIAHATQQFFFSITNFSDVSQTISVVISDSKNILKTFLLHFTEQETISNSIVIHTQEKVVLLKIEEKDNFLLDNTIYLTRKDPLAIWISPKKQTMFLPLLKTIPGISLCAQQQQADILFISEEAELQGVDSKSKIVLLNCALNDFKIPNHVFSPEVIPTSHEMLFGVSFPQIEIKNALTIPSYSWEALWLTKEGCILGIHANYLYVGFDIEETYWTEHYSFPIFWYNYFNTISQQKDNFYYVPTQFKNDYVGISGIENEKIARNLISKYESNNIGKDNSYHKIQKNKVTTNFFFSWKSLCIALLILILCILWHN